MSSARPDFKEMKTLRGILRDCDSRLQDIAVFHEEQKAGVLDTLHRYQLSYIQDDMEEISVHTLRSVIGASKVSMLENAGAGTIYDLYEMDEQEIINIRGIGKITAERVKKVVNEITGQMMVKVPVRFDLENMSTLQKRLLRALYLDKNSVEISKTADFYYRYHHKGVVSVLTDSEKITNRFRWFFSSSAEKEKLRMSYAFLKSMAQGELKEITARLDDLLNKLTGSTEKDILRDFEEHASEYYALLEKYADRELTGEDVGENDLESDLIREINTVQLDESLLNVTLRHYQNFGVKYILHQKKVLLGDEMGLGKTIQALAVMADLSAHGHTHFLVVCPTGIMVNWCREIESKTKMKSILLHGHVYENLQKWIRNGGIAVVNYESLTKIHIPDEMKLSMITADEAHYVKNPGAIRTQALLILKDKAEYVLYMTGTPLENNIAEMHYLISCLREDIADEIEGIRYFAEAKVFREKIAPVYLRRRREDVLQELPELTEILEWTPMKPVEWAAYAKSVAAGNFMEMRRVSWNAAESSKAERLLELCLEAREEKRKVVVFSFFLETIMLVQAVLEGMTFPSLTGSLNSSERQFILDEFAKSEDKHVLVAQIQAGGVGLNIQSASIVILCEPQLKPSAEKQAISRVYRMGQVRNVLVYKLLSEGTIDEYLVERLGNKQEIFDTFADESEAGEQSKISSEWIKEIIEKEKIKVAEEIGGEEDDRKEREPELQ